MGVENLEDDAETLHKLRFGVELVLPFGVDDTDRLIDGGVAKVFFLAVEIREGNVGYCLIPHGVFGVVGVNGGCWPSFLSRRTSFVLVSKVFLNALISSCWSCDCCCICSIRTLFDCISLFKVSKDGREENIDEE